MADFKDIKLDDVLVDKYGNEFKVHDFLRSDYDLAHKIIAKRIKCAENSPVVYVPAYRFGSNDEYVLKEFTGEAEFNSFGLLILFGSNSYIFELIDNPKDDFKYVPCYSEMYIKTNQGILDVLDDLLKRISLSQDEKERFLSRIGRVNKSSTREVLDEESLAVYLAKKINDMKDWME